MQNFAEICNNVSDHLSRRIQLTRLQLSGSTCSNHNDQLPHLYSCWSICLSLLKLSMSPFLKHQTSLKASSVRICTLINNELTKNLLILPIISVYQRCLSRFNFTPILLNSQQCLWMGTISECDIIQKNATKMETL